jgi:hypothetical protein
LVGALLVSVSWISVGPSRQGSVAASDDREIFTAILEHTVRPEVVRFSTIAKIPGTPPLLVLDFDRKRYQAVSVARPGEFLNVPDVGRLVKKLIRG